MKWYGSGEYLIGLIIVGGDDGTFIIILVNIKYNRWSKLDNTDNQYTFGHK